METKKRFTTIEEYIKAQPVKVRGRLQSIRQIVKKIAPRAAESISYNMPAFKVGKSILVYFAAHASHIGLYPYPSAIQAFKNESAEYKTTKGTIQFPHDKKLPISLIAKIVKYRAKEKQNGVSPRKV